MPLNQRKSILDKIAEEYGKEDSKITLSGETSFADIPISEIVPYHDHKFQLYTGQRLDDMVESIREYGVLTPCIIKKLNEGYYEMLAGHNRMQAAQIVGLDTLPCVIKDNLTPKEELAFVIDTNLIQRSLTDMPPSEQAVVLQLRYDKMSSQGQRNDILSEITFLQTGKVEELEKSDSTSGQCDQKLTSREKLAEEYGLSSKTIARLIRLNYLTKELQDRIDNGKLALLAGVQLSFLPYEAQRWTLELSEELKCSLTERLAKLLKNQNKEQKDGLTRDMISGIMQGILAENKPVRPAHKVRVSKTIYDQYFKTWSEDAIQDVIDKAVNAWFDAGN